MSEIPPPKKKIKMNYASMDVLMCFQADVLLEILRVRVSGQVKVSRP